MPSTLSTEDKISNLKDLNGTLLKQVSSYRLSNSDLEAKVKSLEKQIEEILARLDEVSMDKNTIKEENYRVEQELFCSKREAARLETEKEDLLKEREALLVNMDELKASLFDSEEKVKNSLEKLVESQKATVSEEGKCHKLHIEASQLLNERDALLIEIRNLRVANEESQISLAGLYEKEKSLEKQLSEMRKCAEASEIQANEAIQSLQSELSDRLKEREGFQMQLIEAWNQIASIELQREDTISWQKKLESQSKALELDLMKAQEEHSNALDFLNKERELEKLSLESMLELANSKARLLEQELDSVKSLLSTMEIKSSRDKEEILRLEIEVSTLAKERVSLEDAKSSLEVEIVNLKSSCEKLSYEAESEMRKLESQFKTLELDLIKAQEEHCSVLDSLNKQRELEKVSLESMLEIANTEARGLERELNSVKGLLSMVEVESVRHKEGILQLEMKLSNLAQEKESLKKAKSSLEEEIVNLNSASDKVVYEAKSEMGKLESRVKTLELDLLRAREEHAEVLDSIKKEKEFEKGSLESMLDVTNSKSQVLEQELNLVKDLLSTVENESSREKERILQLETEHSALIREIESLEAAKSSLEIELMNLKLGCEKTASEAKRDVENLKLVIAKLESSLSEARESAFRREKSMCQLELDVEELSFHLRKREKLIHMSLPLALASTGSLIGVGIAAMLRHSKHR